MAEAETGDEEGDTTATNEDSNSASDHFQQEHKVHLPKLNVEKKEDEDGGLVKLITASLHRRSTEVDLTKLNDEKEKEETDEEATRRPTSPVTPNRDKRPTAARLRSLNRALKPIAAVPADFVGLKP